MITSYKYKANDKESYLSLKKEVATIFATVTLIPDEFTIIVTPPEEHPEQINEIGKFIDTEGLNFQIEPVEESVDQKEIELLGKLKNVEDELVKMKSNRDYYYDAYIKAAKKEDRIKKLVKSCAIMIASIYPEES